MAEGVLASLPDRLQRSEILALYRKEQRRNLQNGRNQVQIIVYFVLNGLESGHKRHPQLHLESSGFAFSSSLAAFS